MRRSIILLVALVVIIIIPVKVSLAETIIYGWTGTIEPREEGVDPWDVGEQGRVFTVSVFLDDSKAPEVGFAFIPDKALLEIDDVGTFSFSGGTIFDASINFREREFWDGITVSFEEVQFNGVVEPFFTTARLPTSTFTLGGAPERLPLFPPTDTFTVSGGVSDRSSYGITVDAGVTVTAMLIPEPSALLLAVLALVSFGNRSIAPQLGLFSSRRRS